MPAAIDFVADEEAQSPPAKTIDFQPDQPSRERQFRESTGVAGYPVPASGEERAARDVALTQRAGLPLGGGEHLPEEVTSPVAAINTAMRYVGKGATEVLNAPARLSNLISGAKPGEKPYIPVLESEKPLVQLPQITPEQMQGESKPTQVAAGVYNKLAEFGSGISAPGTILPAVALPGGIAKAAFGGQIAANIPGTIQESAKTLRDPKATLMEKGGAVIAPPAEAWMLRQIIKSAPTLPNAAKAAAESIGVETLKKGVPQNAIPIRSSEAVSVGETPGGSPQVGQRVSQPEAPAKTQAPKEAQQSTLRLTDEDQAHIDAERASVDVPVEVRAPTNDEPFAQAKAGQIASIDRQRGTIVINPAEFSGWLNEDMKGLSPERKRLAVRSLLAEERNHLATDSQQASAYWNTLTTAEKAIESKLYTGAVAGRADVSRTDLGFEAIRRRMQRLARMDSTETAAAAGKERWGLKSLEVLNDAIRTIRETLGTKASKEGLAILAKVQGNLDAARIVAGGGNPASLRQTKPEDRDSVARATILAQEQQAKEMRDQGHSDIAEGIENNVSALKQQYPRWQEQNFPAALRRKRPEDDRQQGFFLPETKGKGVLSKPPTQPATEGAPELRGKPVTASELEADVVRHLSQTARPSFADFAAGAKAKYGPELQSGQLRELWQESVWKRLTSATGSELGRLRDQLGLGREFGDRTIADPTAEAPGFQLEGEATKQAKVLDAAGRERQLAEQRYRNNVAARIGEKLIAEAETGRKAWRRKEVSPDEVATWRETSEGAFRPVSKDETNDPAALGRTLTEGAATERSTVRRAARGGRTVEVRSKAPPESVTKRLTAFVNRATGKVELVSTYRSGRAGAMVVDPAKLGSMRPNVPLATALTRYHPIYSVLLDEPVQNFHQSFESVRDFEERFGAEARQRVQEANQTAEPPPAATEAQPEPPGSLSAGKPLQDNEATAVLDHIISETGKFDSPDDVGLAINALANDVKRMPSAKLNWPALVGFQKIYNALREKWPLLDHDQAMAQMAEELYDRHQKAGTFDEFVAGATRDYQRQGKEAVRRPELGPTETAAAGRTRAGESGKELTMRQRVPPTVAEPSRYTGRNVPQWAREKAQLQMRETAPPESEGLPELPQGESGQISQGSNLRSTDRPLSSVSRTGKKEAPPIPVATPGEIKPPQMLSAEDLAAVKHEAEIKAAQRESNPAALRRVQQAKEATLAEADRIYGGIKSLILRKDINDAIPKGLDAADNVANNIGREFESSVRLTAGATGKSRRGDMKALTAANPVRDSGAVVARFNHNMLSPTAKAKFKTLTSGSPKWPVASAKMVSPNPAVRAEGWYERGQIIKEAYRQLINDGDLRADSATYAFDDNARIMLPQFMNQVDAAAAKARTDLKGAGWFETRILKKKLRFLQNLREELVHADKNWTDPTLRETAIQAQKEFDRIFQRGVDFGSNLHYDADYSPGRYEGEFISEGKILFPGMNMLGGRWKSPKTFKNIYEAVGAGPYMSITRDIASMVGHRARQEERAIGRQQWVSSFKNMVDPESGLPVGADPKKDANGNPAPPSADYEVLYPFRNKPIAVHKGWSRLVKTLTGDSKVQEFPPSRVALELAQRLKHTLLIGDFFHLGRLSYYAASIMGRKAGFHGGLAALDFREADLPRAVKQGLVSQAAADWVTQKIPVQMAGRSVLFTRRQIADGFQRQGLNVGQIQDALYKDLTGNVPLVGPYNKWLFDSYTRGLMMESAVKEFERLNAARPDIDSRTLMRDVAKDVNRFYGSIGRQGWFKSRTWQDLSRLALLAPQWVEGLVMKEAGFYKRAAYTATGAHALGAPGGRAGLPAMGTLGRGIGNGVMTMLALTQAINLITRHKPTWQNEEEGHKFDAWIPGGDHGFFLNPLSVFNELSHDLWRYGETKPKAWDAVSQIGQNKLSPFGRLGLVLATGKSPTGEYQTTSGGVLGKGAEQLAPVPISFGRAAREVGHTVAPGVVAPNPPGAFQRQAMQWAGLKAEPAGSASQRVGRMAQRFMEANGLGKTGFQFDVTDQPSYVKLRTALRNGDEKAAAKIMQQIGKTPAEIGKAMKGWAARPWTGSKKADRAFFATLSDQELDTVSAARLERQQLLEKFYDLMLSQP